MEGKARATKLPERMKRIPGVIIFASGPAVRAASAGRLVELQDAEGATFGPEIGIGARLRELRPGQPAALIKYAIGGSSLERDWRPGADAADVANEGPDFRKFVKSVHDGMAALEAAGWTPVIRGMAWQQGEQDAKAGLDAPETKRSADEYGKNLVHFIVRIRQEFGGEIRFVTGQVLPFAPFGGDVRARFPGRDLVGQAILDLDTKSGSPLAVANTAAIPTDAQHFPTNAQVIDGYRDADEVHLGDAAQLSLGRAMADALLER